MVCGLGARPEDEVTLGQLRELESCDALFCAEGTAGPVLARFGLRGRPVPKRPEAMLAAGRRVGLALWGHPDFTSRLALRLAGECRRKGARLTVVPGASPVGSLLASSASFFGGGDFGYLGILAQEAPGSAGEHWLPLVLFAEKGDWPRAARALCAAYGPGHKAWAQPEDGPARLITVAELSGLKERACALVPPKRRAARRPR